MDLPDCPPGAEGYQDSVTEVPRKYDDTTCTKAEQEFQEHLNSLKIKLEDGTTRNMVERSGRDVAGKWIYLCYPCAAVCSGESILQTHISGKKHKAKLALTNRWPCSIFDDHPYHQASAKTAEKPQNVREAQEDFHNRDAISLEQEFSKYRNIPCQIEESLKEIKTPIIGLEYLIEHPPVLGYSPSYICTLCMKQGQPRTIVNHITCERHRNLYLLRHFPKACSMLAPYRSQTCYREGVGIVVSRLAQRIEDKCGRQKPVNIEKEEYEKDKERIHRWIFKGRHYDENEGGTLEEIVDIDLITSLSQNDSSSKDRRSNSSSERRDPSPPVVAAPAKPHFNHFSRPAGRQERRTGSVESLSDISDEGDTDMRRDSARNDRNSRPDDRRRAMSPVRSRYIIRNNIVGQRKSQEKTRPPNYEYKLKLAAEKRAAAEEFAKKTLAYHEKNPEKHPLYPEEWKKFWNKRYKEIQAEGKDPSKHDFKPEWIVFWTARMKVLHDEELRVTVNELYRKMCLSPPDMSRSSAEPPRRALDARRPPDTGRRLDDVGRRDDRRRSPFDRRRRSPDSRRRSPDPRRRSPDLRRRSPDLRRRSPDMHRRSPDPRRRSPDYRHRSPLHRRSPDFKRDRRSPMMRRSPIRRRSIDRHRSPLAHRPLARSRSPIRLSPMRGRGALEGRSGSPLSQRGMQARNRSPEHELAPSMQTVLISDDELKPDDGGLSPWNSDNEIGSVGSSASRRRGLGGGAGGGAPDDVVATLRLLVALEDYLGSLGPKLVDLLAEALKMEKEKANSSEELLVRESAVVLIETAKEKLKGAAQAGLVTGSAATAARAAVVRAAATLHEADKRARKKQQAEATKSSLAVAGVGAVDRAQIAQQMAAALVAQGKTDVSSDELAQLVDAVVGMAEAKQRQARRAEPARPAPPAAPRAAGAAGTTSALQMLQSAYDENDKRIEKDDAPDAMDGLSDSDLETLLKNFNELSAEEQHSLIAYLKKLEAREPARVERLRKYVSDAAHGPAPAPGPAPAAGPAPDPAPAPKVDSAQLVLESDDDDYTVEEVFKSATQKVKEDQIRQEMEIVKKSLEESKPSTPTAPVPEKTPEPAASVSSIADLSRHLSSASDLFALVQATIKSTTTPTPAPIVQPPEVVVSNTQPRSFGDLPEVPLVLQESLVPPAPLPSPSPLLRMPQDLGDNRKLQTPPSEHYQHGGPPPTDQYEQDNQRPNEDYNQSNPPPNEQFGQNDRFVPGNQPPNDRFAQGNLPINNRFGQVPTPNDRFGQGNPQNDRFGQGNPPMNERFGQINQPPIDRFPQQPNDRFGPGNQQPNDRFPPGNQPQIERFAQGNQPQMERFGPGNQPQMERFGPGNQPPNDRFGQPNQPPNDRFIQGNQPIIDRFVQGSQPFIDRFGQNIQPNEVYNQINQWIRPNTIMLENRAPLRGPNNPVQLLASGPYNPGLRQNFMNRNNFDNRPQMMNQQQFGNYDNQNNFRGRGGRGHFGGGPMRGRGRGYY
ncbi:uncharacterized protein CG7065-like isoform X2 [Anticarsia gemmatalis]|uniref:uncharacterized protein CG7065-like isoform X2 n=1 Tax=Anticarsia gemmatalis TaxID=129554 RepID=UPI003F769F6E